jgi:DNA topoisomerase-1
MGKLYSSKTISCFSQNHTLIIVESFSKCKKIEEYLGLDYKCVASGGHIRELNNINNIGETNDYNPKFDIIKSSFVRKNLKNLKQSIQNANEVILATDDDREGEAIAWHICMVFKLNISTTKRIKFNEITKTAVNIALLNPTFINMDIVNAQQSRQIMDLMVGYKISPMLWKHFTHNKSFSKKGMLSAGRCQTPTLKLIYDNHYKIINREKINNDGMLYTTYGYFSQLNIQYKLNESFNQSSEVIEFINMSKTFNNELQESSITKTTKNPPLPLNTSALQQQSNIQLNLTPKTTMNICQTLYDEGFITYIRTDSKRFNSDFIKNATVLINNSYGSEYVNKNIASITTGCNGKNTKSAGSSKTLIQDAHESIRPTNLALMVLPRSCSPITQTMYNLIYKISIQSCMSPALYNVLKTRISAPSSLYYECNLEQVYFSGWQLFNKNNFSGSVNKLKVLTHSKYKSTITINEKYNFIQLFKSGCTIKCNKITSEEKMTLIGSHYSEATLINKLEQLGIGRPSTYSSLIEKVQERGYVIKQDYPGVIVNCNVYNLDFIQNTECNMTHNIIENTFGAEKNKLCITSLGYLINYFLTENYNDIFNYNYTKDMEIDIDFVANGIKNKKDVCRVCNEKIVSLISGTNCTKIPRFSINIENMYELIVGKYGPVIKKSNKNKDKNKDKDKEKDIFYQSKNITNLDIVKLHNHEYKADDLIQDLIIDNDNDNDNGEKPEQNKDSGGLYVGLYNDVKIYLKQGKYGYYTHFEGTNISLKKLGKRPIENIKLDEIIKIIDNKNNYVRTINNEISIRKGTKYGDYFYYKTDIMKKPSFVSFAKFKKHCKINEIKNGEDISGVICPYTCDENIIIEWITNI